MIDVGEALPEGPLREFLDARLPEARGAAVEVVPVGQGRSNLTFLVQRGSQRLILRRPPLGDLPATAHDMMREYRVIEALGGTKVRVPRLVLACEDSSVIGVPFYLMEEVRGVVIRDTVPEAYGEAERGAIGFELVDALAELHTVDIAAAGLAGLGKPEGYTARQVRRWAGKWEVMATRELRDIELVREWLESNVPAQARSAVVHGDYKLDNVVLSAAPPARLEAILDWEMATLGDPLADLGYFSVFWQDPGEDALPGMERPTRQAGFARRAELVARYEQRTGLAVTDLEFYRVLALWKLAILLEGLYKRYLAGKASSDWYAVLEGAVPAMAAQARGWCAA